MNQGSLFDAPLVPRATPGTYLSPSGADMKGPLVVICEGCNVPAMYRPAVGPCACPTPAAHTWTGDEPEETAMDETTPITQQLRDHIAQQVDIMLALAGEGGDDPVALRAAIDAELGSGDFAAWPTKRGEQVRFVEQLGQVVLERLGTPLQETAKTGPRVQSEGFDDDSAGAPIIKHPIGS